MLHDIRPVEKLNLVAGLKRVLVGFEDCLAVFQEGSFLFGLEPGEPREDTP